MHQTRCGRSLPSTPCLLSLYRPEISQHETAKSEGDTFQRTGCRLAGRPRAGLEEAARQAAVQRVLRDLHRGEVALQLRGGGREQCLTDTM